MQPGAVVLGILVALLAQGAAGVRHLGDSPQHLAAAAHCGVELQFHEYLPSAWEAFWLTHGSSLQHRVCESMLEDEDKTSKWLNTIEHFKTVGDVQKVSWDPAVFSKYTYKNKCKPHDPPIEVFIEPAVGVLRHPHAACTQKVEIQERSYIVLSGLSGATLKDVYPGRKYLFDLGTNAYHSSLDWFDKAYGGIGIEFDDVYAWELAHMDPKAYWASVTETMVEKLHFYNIGIDNDTTKASHPLNIMKSIYRPGDLIIVKLDIDNEELESFILKEIETDPHLAAIISDIFVEMHFDSPVMNAWFGNKLKQKLADVLKFFHTFRSLGIRMHPWP
ncbi:hypothetical protein WJX72_004819 [[Myrmecia] bisecta]|uniref:Methyltransferase domain-containing protein n=1 Tax=[Myrmecia] bisecta TaxID=41462 RepID=A0AAW1QQ93_9CHLO